MFVYMQNNILSVEINRPVAEVFNFTLNPENTPLWVDGILHEEINTPAPQLGTRYRNKSRDGVWNEYEITDFVPQEAFTFTQLQSPYRVRYDFKMVSKGVTELTYTEWMEEGSLESPFDMSPLKKLKSLIESSI